MRKQQLSFPLQDNKDATGSYFIVYLVNNV